jgi:hypothetical protein
LSLHTTVTLLPIHDFFGLIIHFGRTVIEPNYDGAEGIVFDLTMGKGAEGFQGEGAGVWAVVDKDAMRETKEKRWDLVS